MSETYTPTGNVGTALKRATSGEATGTHGSEFMRTNITTIADKIRFLTDAGLVNFPATQVTSADPNCLDDYEEGTFTPTLIGATSGVASYTKQEGAYTKIGRRVFYTIALFFTKNTVSGDVRAGGLPFTSAATVVNNAQVCGPWLGMGSSLVSMSALIPASVTYISLFRSTAASTNQEGTPLLDTDLSGGSHHIYVAGSYEV